MLTEQQAYRYGYLYRCAEEGLSYAGAVKRAGALVKRAEALVKRAEENGWAGHLKDLAGLGAALGGLGVALPIAGTVLGGAGIGYGLVKMREPSIDPKELRDQELISAYDSYARQARLKALAHKYRPPRTPTYARF